MGGDEEFRDLARRFMDGRLSRRRFLEASALLGLSGLAALVVAACGSQATATPSATTGATASAAPPSAAPASIAPSAAAGGTITVAAAQGIPQLDPYKILFAWEEVLLPVLWDSLTGYIPGNPAIQPWLAESWTTSDDLKTYTFKIRQGVTYSNGKALTAQDVATDINRALDPKTVWIYSFLLPKVLSVKALDASTVEFLLEQGSANLPIFLYKLPIMDPSTVEQINTQPVGTGPFVVKEFVPEDHLTVTRNPTYWGPKPKLDSINFIKAQDPTAAVTALRGGDIDVLWSVPWQDAKQLQDGGQATIVTSEIPSAPILFETDNTTPPFDNVKARQALVYATDKQTIIDTAYAGKALISTTNQPIPSNHSDFNSALPAFAFDLQKAKALFAEAGIKEGSTLTFWTTAGQYAEWTTYGQILQSDFAKIGIKLEIKANEINTWAAKFAPAGQKWPGLLVPNIYSGMPAEATIGFWLPGICECNYNKPAFIEALSQADAAKDPAKRRELLGKAQEIFAQDAPVVIIGQTSWPIAVRPGVAGVWEDPGANMHVESASRS